jgi:hypothetical protein
MLSVDEEQEVDVRSELALLSRSMRATSRQRWDVRPDADGAGVIHVQLTADWLAMTADLGDQIAILATHADDAWNCLQANREFNAGVKIVLQPDTGRLGAAVEVPWSEDDPDRKSHLNAAFKALTQASRWRPGTNATYASAESIPTLDLAELCRSTDWPCNERADGSVAVSLETAEGVLGGGGCLALVEHDATRGVMVRLEMLSAKEADLTTPIRLAMGRMLLKAGGLVRFARPVAWTHDSRIKAGFEVALGRAATPARLAAALCALSVSWQLCGREMQALTHQPTAEAFLNSVLQSSDQ